VSIDAFDLSLRRRVVGDRSRPRRQARRRQRAGWSGAGVRAAHNGEATA